MEVLGEDGFDLKNFSQYTMGDIRSNVHEIRKSPCYNILRCSFDWDQIWALPIPWISAIHYWRKNWHPLKKPGKSEKVLIFTFTVSLPCTDFSNIFRLQATLENVAFKQSLCESYFLDGWQKSLLSKENSVLLSWPQNHFHVSFALRIFHCSLKKPARCKTILDELQTKTNPC